MSNRDWQLIKAELQAAISRSQTEPVLKDGIPRQSTAPELGDGTAAALDQIARALRQSED